MTQNAVMPKTIKEWQQMFHRIYGKNNDHLTDVDAWLHLTEETAEFAKVMRKENYAELRQSLPDLFAWLCAFANRSGIDIEGALWEKYPRVCPYCEKRTNCVCIAEAQHVKYDPDVLKNFVKNNSRPRSVSEWHAMFKDIYGNMNRVLSRDSIGFHLIEEVGQVARKIREKKPDEYAIELADVFAWLIAVTMKLEGEIPSLDTITWEMYPGICKRCKQAECICLVGHRQPREQS